MKGVVVKIGEDPRMGEKLGAKIGRLVFPIPPVKEMLENWRLETP